MTPKQILDSFSETLMQDERILSAQERALLSTLLQHAKAATAGNPGTKDAVRAVIASAVGETVAQRAFSVLGGSIVERILESERGSEELDSLKQGETYKLGSPPTTPQPPGSPPGQPQSPRATPQRTADSGAAKWGVTYTLGSPPTSPQPPGSPSSPGQPQSPAHPVRQPQSPAKPLDTPTQPQPPAGQPQSPAAPLRQPQSPASVHAQAASKSVVALAEYPSVLPARCVVLDEFLAPQELEELTRFTLAHEADFAASEVVSEAAEGGVINDEHRRSRVLMDLGEHEARMLARIQSVLPEVLGKLGMEPFTIAGSEVQITASNDGDFFHFHNDNGSERVASRYLTFVYFFHREPRQFEGGELRIHDARLKGGSYVSEGRYQAIIPRQNQIVFFPCELMHEITPVKCPSCQFADSRFTLNGWLRR